MTIPHANPGEAVNLRPLGSAHADTHTRTLMRGKDLEVIKLVLPSGMMIREHKAKGDIVVQCLQGRILFTACGRMQILNAGDCLYLPNGEPHSLQGVQHASALLTIALPRKENRADWEGGQPEPAHGQGDEVHRQRGVFLSIAQAVVLVAALALLFAVAADGILVGAVSIAAVMAIIACLHYWTWGRWMSRAHS